MKTQEEYFRDWEADMFGTSYPFGYGTGEVHTLSALKNLFSAFGVYGRLDSYDYQQLEEAVTPTVAWLLINALCRKGTIDCGTSPRYGWLSPGGKALRQYVSGRTVEELYEICTNYDESYIHCGSTYCNCDPDAAEGKECDNPFWK